MKPGVSADVLIDHFKAEKAVLERLLAGQKNVYRYVAERDWIMLNESLESCNACAAEFEQMERKREVLTGTDVNSFYAFSARYNHDDKCRLNESFRELKQLFMISRAEHESLEAYVSHVSTLLNGFLDIAVPSRRNRMYSRSGAVVQRDVENLVLNRAL